MIERCYQLPGLFQVAVRQALKRVRSFSDLVEVRADAVDIVMDLLELLLDALRQQNFLLCIGQSRITNEWSEMGLGTLSCPPQNVVLGGIEIAGDPVGIGSVHGWAARPNEK